MTPAELALVDRTRAAVRKALETECGCGECPADEQLLRILAVDDETLLSYIELGLER